MISSQDSFLTTYQNRRPHFCEYPNKVPDVAQHTEDGNFHNSISFSEMIRDISSAGGF